LFDWQSESALQLGVLIAPFDQVLDRVASNAEFEHV
jgi:hypothetical protein